MKAFRAAAEDAFAGDLDVATASLAHDVIAELTQQGAAQ